MEDEAVYFLFLVLFAVLFSVSCFMKSRVAKWLLRIVSIWGIVAIFINAFLEYDCQRDKFFYINCALLPESMWETLSALNLFNIPFIGLVAPVLVLISLGFEVYTRKLKSKTQRELAK